MKYKTLVKKDGTRVEGLLKDSDNTDEWVVILADKSKKTIPKQEVVSI